jgi:hypothetical protein
MNMRIRFTRAGYAVAAGVAVTAMLGMGAASAAGASVSHAKPLASTACGAACSDASFQVPGPTDILGAHSGLNVTNNVVRLLQGSNASFNGKEDFTRVNVGTVFPLYCTATGQAQTGSIFTDNQCHLLSVAGLLAATTFQYAFNPNNGGPEDMCLGAWNNNAPASGWKIRLEPCGIAPDTVIISTPKLPGGNTSTGVWWVNGGSDNYSNPLVATNPGNAPSQVTWTTIDLNGKHAADTQEVHTAPGPF